MNDPLLICGSCSCHLRASEKSCPHCGADLRTGGWRAPERRQRFIRRVLVATVAVSGALTAGCGENTDVLGDCAAPNYHYDCTRYCSCGTGGLCTDGGTCVACGCASNQYCEYPGKCITIAPSHHTCYGSPPPHLYSSC